MPDTLSKEIEVNGRDANANGYAPKLSWALINKDFQAVVWATFPKFL